jgi:hypothetical protein
VKVIKGWVDSTQQDQGKKMVADIKSATRKATLLL